MKKYADVFIGIILIIFAVVLIVMTKPLPAQSAIFPKVVAGIMIFLSVLMIISSYRAGKKEEVATEAKEENISLKDVIKGGILILSYIVLMPKLGFFSTTALFIALFMLAFRERSVKRIITTVVLLNVFIYMIFVAQLNVPLPQGLIF